MKQHRFDPLSYSFGLVYLLLGVLFLLPADLNAIDDVFRAVGPWLLPVVVFSIAAAVIGPVLYKSLSSAEE